MTCCVSHDIAFESWIQHRLSMDSASLALNTVEPSFDHNNFPDFTIAFRKDNNVGSSSYTILFRCAPPLCEEPLQALSRQHA